MKRGRHLPRFICFWTNTQPCAEVTCGVALVTAKSCEGPRKLHSVRASVRARIAATLLNPELNTALRLEVPHHITAEQAKTIFEIFLRISLDTLRTYEDEMRGGDPELMAEIVIGATHAIVDNLAASNPERLASQEVEDEISLMMYRYLAK